MTCRNADRIRKERARPCRWSEAVTPRRCRDCHVVTRLSRTAHGVAREREVGMPTGYSPSAHGSPNASPEAREQLLEYYGPEFILKYIEGETA